MEISKLKEMMGWLPVLSLAPTAYSFDAHPLATGNTQSKNLNSFLTRQSFEFLTSLFIIE